MRESTEEVLDSRHKQCLDSSDSLRWPDLCAGLSVVLVEVLVAGLVVRVEMGL